MGNAGIGRDLPGNAAQACAYLCLLFVWFAIARKSNNFHIGMFIADDIGKKKSSEQHYKACHK